MKSPAERKLLKAKQARAMKRPKIFIYDQYKSETIYMHDVQHFLLFSSVGDRTSYWPSWCKVLRQVYIPHIVVVEVDSLTHQQYIQHQSETHILQDFNENIHVFPPKSYGSETHKEIFDVPITKTQAKKRKRKAEEQVECKVTRNDLEHCPTDLDQPCSKLDLLLNKAQMIDEGFPVPGTRWSGNQYVFSQEEYKPVTASSPLYGLDCEMCNTTSGMNELTWVSIVNEKGESVYNSFVKPYNKITNYKTQYSGITADSLKGVTTRLEDVQSDIRKCLEKDAILCGHSLSNDLRSLYMYHPYVIDSSCIYNMKGVARRVKDSLKNLTFHHLGRMIQCSTAGHDPTEDSVAALDLVKKKLQQGILYSDLILQNQVEQAASKADNHLPIGYFQKLLQQTHSIFSYLQTHNKQSCLYGTASSKLKEHGSSAMYIETQTNLQTVKQWEKHRTNSYLSWLHIDMQKYSPSSTQKAVDELHKLIQKVHEAASEKTLICILLNGDTNQQSCGSCFIHVK